MIQPISLFDRAAPAPMLLDPGARLRINLRNRRVVVRTLKALPWAIVLLAAAVRPASADGFLTPYIGFNFGGDSSNCASLTTCEDKRTNFGVSVGSMGSALGFEEDIAFATDFFGKVPGADNSVFTAMSNLLTGVGVGRVQPYVLIGIGLIRPHTSLKITQNVTEFQKNSLGYDLGGGINGYFTRHVGIRGDIRRFKTLQDVPILKTITNQVLQNDKLEFWRASLGLAFRF